MIKAAAWEMKPVSNDHRHRIPRIFYSEKKRIIQMVNKSVGWGITDCVRA